MPLPSIKAKLNQSASDGLVDWWGPEELPGAPDMIFTNIGFETRPFHNIYVQIADYFTLV